MGKIIKVGLISFHNAFNYGAAMQAYGLQEALTEMGVEAEYINYVNEHRKYIYDTPYQIKAALKSHNIIRAVRLLAGAGFISARGRKFRAFYDKHLKTTRRVYSTSDEARKLNEVYDKFVVGSDQVWNSNNNGADTAYLLDFVDDPEKKFSYSSSFGMDDIPEKYRDAYTKSLKNLGRIGVREVAGAKIVQKYSGRKPHVVLDPVFLAGVGTWNRIKNEGTVKKENYVFFYTNRASQVKEFWNIGYPKGNLKSHILSSFVGVKDFLDKDTSVRVAMAPADFLNEIDSARLVVTASFHCVAFSILFHKQFVVFLTGNRGKDERIINLLRICGLESRIITSTTTTKDINKKIDYSDVDARLQPYLDYSRNYLYKAIFSLPDVEKIPLPTRTVKYFCDDERCSGCMVCKNICPVYAISMVKNEEGFMIPVRDENKCVNCYKCHNVCQVFEPVTRSDYSQRYFAAKNENSIRLRSSSGGVFTAISDVILENKGVICAAEMDEKFRVKHVFADNKSQRDKMCRTFYVQSDISDVFDTIRVYLKNSIPVLFVGTPCQVAGVYKALQNVDTTNLFTCDIVCHGIPSPGVFEGFIEFLRRKYGNLKEFNFRDKSLGWRHGYTVSAVIGKKKIKNTLALQSFSKMFSRNLINRKSCANCQYSNYDRVGDITIGDFWGIKKYHPKLFDDLGVSLVIENTEKGKSILKKCSSLRLKEVEKAETVQNSLIKCSDLSADRMNAFKIYYKKGYEKLAVTYGDINAKGGIINVVRKILKK